MSQKWDPYVQTFKTNANFAATPWHLVTWAADGDIDLCGAGELPLGALTDVVGESNTDDKYVDVQVGQVIRVEAGATVTGGVLVMSNAAGEAIDRTTGNHVIGIALHGAADGEALAVLWAPSYYEEG